MLYAFLHFKLLYCFMFLMDFVHFFVSQTTNKIHHKFDTLLCFF